MKGEFTRTLIITDEEQKIISKFMDIMDAFELDFEKDPEDLVDIMYAIPIKNHRAYLCRDKGTIEIKYQDD